MVRNMKIVCAAAGALLALQAAGAKPKPIVCEGEYPYHLQGVATDGTNVYWTFTTVLAKTDWSGKLIGKTSIEKGHMGDLCFRDGKLYVGMNHGRKGGARVGDEVWIYDAQTLELKEKHSTPEPAWCNNGLDWYGGSFWIITSAPRHSQYNFLYEYTPDFKYRTCILVKSGWTNLGVQTICRKGDVILLGCYGGDDPEQPHKSCTVAIDGKRLLAAAHGRQNKPVPILWRKDVNTAEGLLVRDGKIWEAHSILLSAKNGKKIWTAQLFQSQGLDESEKKGETK